MIDKKLTSRLAQLLYNVYEVNYLTCLAIQEMEAKAKAFDYVISRYDREFFDRFDTYEDYMSYYEDLDCVGTLGSDCGISKEPPISKNEFETIKKALEVKENV